MLPKRISKLVLDPGVYYDEAFYKGLYLFNDKDCEILDKRCAVNNRFWFCIGEYDLRQAILKQRYEKRSIIYSIPKKYVLEIKSESLLKYGRYE